MSRSFARFSLLLFIVWLAASHAAGQTLFLFGTWTLNASKSSLGGPPPQRQTVSFRTAGAEGILGVEDTIYADGTRTLVQYAAKPDGREYPMTGSAEILVRANTVSLTRVNAASMKWVYKKDGVVVLSLVGEVSPDGRTLTLKTGDDRVLVYEKQG